MSHFISVDNFVIATPIQMGAQRTPDGDGIHLALFRQLDF
jgi:hypothetical protein